MDFQSSPFLIGVSEGYFPVAAAYFSYLACISGLSVRKRKQAFLRYSATLLLTSGSELSSNAFSNGAMQDLRAVSNSPIMAMYLASSDSREALS